MKKLLAVLFALLSGLYLLLLGPIPEPLPFLDEGIALLVFLNCLAYLGLDLRRFFGMKSKKEESGSQTIDIE